MKGWISRSLLGVGIHDHSLTNGQASFLRTLDEMLLTSTCPHALRALTQS